MMKLEGKNALVTGSNRGIGKSIALRLAKEGANVVINFHRHAVEAARVVQEIESMGRRTTAIGANLADADECERLVGKSIAALGGLDILINNAGLEKRADFWEVTEADYELVMNVNAKSAFFATQAFVRHLRRAKCGGRIINITSIHDELPFPHFAAYGMSKAAVKMLTRDLAIELAPFGITVNSIAPGAIETSINAVLLNDEAKRNRLLENIPLRRLGRPKDVAGVAAFLASEDADYITGATVVVDGGLLWNYAEQ